MSDSEGQILSDQVRKRPIQLSDIARSKSLMTIKMPGMVGRRPNFSWLEYESIKAVETVQYGYKRGQER